MKEAPRARFRVASYNVHGCIGMDRQRSESRIAAVIAELAVDVIGLQELDRNRARSAGVNQAEVIAAELGWFYHFHAAMQSGEEHYGNAILSRYPLSVRRSVCLPGIAPFFCRETRGAIDLEVAMEFGTLHVINTHFGLGRAERLL